MWKKLFSREYAVQYTEVSLRSLSPEVKDLLSAPFYEQIYFPEENNEVCYVDEGKWAAFLQSLEETWGNSFEEFRAVFNETGNSYVSVSKGISERDLAKESNSGLKKLYLGYQAIAVRYAFFIWSTFFLNEVFAEKAKKIIDVKVPEPTVYYDAAFSPEKRAAILALTEAVGGELSDEELRGLHAKYQWIPCLDIHNKPWSWEEVKEHVSHLRKDRAAPKMLFNDLLVVLDPSPEELKILRAAKEMAYIKDARDDYRRQGVFYARALFQEIAKRMDAPLEDVSYMLEQEIIQFLDGRAVVNSAPRKRGFGIYYSGEEITVVSGNGVAAARKELGLRDVGDAKELVTGTVACAGTARGSVSIVKGVLDLKKVQDGDILVAVTTHPDYVPAMQRAAAFVTDEGGMTSHAAIVAREMGVPCIVGTGNATKLLKDGMEIEVDATNGVVRST